VNDMMNTRTYAEIKDGEGAPLKMMSHRIATAVALSNHICDLDNVLSLQFVDCDTFCLSWKTIEVGQLKLHLRMDERLGIVDVFGSVRFVSNIGFIVEDVCLVQKQIVNLKEEFENNVSRTNRRWRRKLAQEHSNN